jgi:hypothetical protein
VSRTHTSDAKKLWFSSGWKVEERDMKAKTLASGVIAGWRLGKSGRAVGGDADDARRAGGAVADVDVLAELGGADEVRRPRDHCDEVAVIADGSGERAVVPLLAGVVDAHQDVLARRAVDEPGVLEEPVRIRREERGVLRREGEESAVGADRARRAVGEAAGPERDRRRRAGLPVEQVRVDVCRPLDPGRRPAQLSPLRGSARIGFGASRCRDAEFRQIAFDGASSTYAGRCTSLSAQTTGRSGR